LRRRADALESVYETLKQDSTKEQTKELDEAIAESLLQKIREEEKEKKHAFYSSYIDEKDNKTEVQLDAILTFCAKPTVDSSILDAVWDINTFHHHLLSLPIYPLLVPTIISPRLLPCRSFFLLAIMPRVFHMNQLSLL